MARSPDDLPEGTDSIIDDGVAAASAGDGIGEPGFASAIGGGASADDTGGTTKRDQFRQKFAEATAGFKEQAGDKARVYAVQGKDRATEALDNLAKLVSDAADSVDQQIGPQYGAYARQAADAVSGFSTTLRDKDVDELVEDAGNLVRSSPAIAIGLAAAVGFVLVRLVKSGLETTTAAAAGKADDGAA